MATPFTFVLKMNIKVTTLDYCMWNLVGLRDGEPRGPLVKGLLTKISSFTCLKAKIQNGMLQIWEICVMKKWIHQYPVGNDTKSQDVLFLFL